MSSLRIPQNPGISGLDELTLEEELVIQQIAGLGDPGADRLLFWDDSAGGYAFLTVGSGLTITDTTITAAGGGGTWGTITGTLSDQTDLQSALDAKFTLPALTAGSVLFSNGTTIAQDNSNLFWDDTNNRLGIGIATPSVQVDFTSGSSFGSNSYWGTSYPGGIRARMTSSLGLILRNTGIFGWVSATLTGTAADPDTAIYRNDAGVVEINDGTAGNYRDLRARAINPTTGNLGIGNTSPSAKLHVTNTTDAASNQVGIWESDRATPAANDEVYMSYKLSDSAGNQDEFARITVTGTTVTSTSEVGRMGFGLVNAGTLATRMYLTPTALTPTTTDTLALGSTSLMWSDLYLAEGGVINWDNGDATLTQAGDVLTLAGADLKVSTPGNASTSVLTTDGAQTVTAKRNQPRTASSTTSATLTPDLSSANVYFRTTQTEALTIAAPTGTPVIGETIAIYVDSAGAQTLTINATYIPFGSAFPATTTAGKTFMLVAQYNGTNWKTMWSNAV